MQTLAYYLAMANTALTPLEIRKYTLLKGGRIPLFEIHNALNSLKNEGIVIEKNGFWTVKTGELSLQNRLEGTKNSAFKWKKFSSTANFIPYVPYIRGVAVTGSVALNNATQKSDIDLLITTKNDRIWTTRFLITIISAILGNRRYGQNITDRLCFNHYMTSDSKAFGPPNISSVVQNINIPVWDIDKKKYEEASVHCLKPSKTGLKLKTAAEQVLDIIKIGPVLEKVLGRIQIAKIKNNSTQYPEELREPSLKSKQLIFYYPKVRDTERKYREIMSSVR